MKRWGVYIGVGATWIRTTLLVLSSVIHPLGCSSPLLNMKVLIVLSMVLVAAMAQNEVPIPYSFNYLSNTEDGGSSKHEESGDGAGSVRGSYTVNDLEGHTRTVDYVADENGFRATVRTNEPGTANLNPADVTVESSADDGGIAAAYSAGFNAARPAVAPATPSGRGRFVLVPITDPRARGYY